MKTACLIASIVLAVSGYRIAPNPDSEQPKLVECGGWYGFFDVVYPSITGPRTIVTSSNFGRGDYANNEKCSVQFRTVEEPINLILNFTDFVLEEGESCLWDSACVDGFEYCGRALNNTVLSYYVPENSSFTFSYKTDSSVTRRGIRVVVDAVSVESEEADLNYEDRCLTQYDVSSLTPIVDPYFPGNTDYPDYGYVTNEFGNRDRSGGDSDYGNNYDYSTGDYNYGNNYDYSTGDYDYGNNYNDYSTGDYDYGNNYNDYSTGDYDYGNNYNDYNTGDYDYGNNYNDYSTGDYDSGNNYNDYNTGDYDYGNISDDYSTGER